MYNVNLLLKINFCTQSAINIWQLEWRAIKEKLLLVNTTLLIFAETSVPICRVTYFQLQAANTIIGLLCAPNSLKQGHICFLCMHIAPATTEHVPKCAN